MERDKDLVSRRAFMKASALAAVSARLGPVFAEEGEPDVTSRVVRIHHSKATRSWDYSANAPWDHTVEPRDGKPGKIAERYFDYIDGDVVRTMLDRGLR